MKRKRKVIFVILIIIVSGAVLFKLFTQFNLNIGFKKGTGKIPVVLTHLKVGERIDSFHHVIVYFNGGVGNTVGRNITADNYNLGLKYQCVEFVKRYYYQYLHHKMPDAQGNAKDFFDKTVADGELNTKRNLVQYCNAGKSKPKTNDLIIFDGTVFNRYGHVAIIDSVLDTRLQIIQQNPGPFAKSRIWISLTHDNGKWTVGNTRTLGWLRKE